MSGANGPTLALLIRELRALFLLDALLAGLAARNGWRRELRREAVDLVAVHAALAFAALRTPALISAQSASISSAAFLSFSGPVLPVVIALM